MTFTITFPDGEAGDAAREVLPKAIELSHDRLCTVSRTVLLPTPVTMTTGTATAVTDDATSDDATTDAPATDEAAPDR